MVTKISTGVHRHNDDFDCLTLWGSQLFGMTAALVTTLYFVLTTLH
ncbi:MAG TPA: hypothetical protein VMF11_15905 [Candidatus Baltobacteraceae bacterium]|nr:hypothetical protein [Candidatus Baltobacteraceae bacterium]